MSRSSLESAGCFITSSSSPNEDDYMMAYPIGCPYSVPCIGIAAIENALRLNSSQSISRRCRNIVQSTTPFIARERYVFMNLTSTSSVCRSCSSDSGGVSLRRIDRQKAASSLKAGTIIELGMFCGTTRTQPSSDHDDTPREKWHLSPYVLLTDAQDHPSHIWHLLGLVHFEVMVFAWDSSLFMPPSLSPSPSSSGGGLTSMGAFMYKKRDVGSTRTDPDSSSSSIPLRLSHCWDKVLEDLANAYHRKMETNYRYQPSSSSSSDDGIWYLAPIHAVTASSSCTTWSSWFANLYTLSYDSEGIPSVDAQKMLDACEYVLERVQETFHVRDATCSREKTNTPSQPRRDDPPDDPPR